MLLYVFSSDTDRELIRKYWKSSPSITWGSSFLVETTLSNLISSNIPTAQIIFGNVQIDDNGVLESPF